MTIQAQSLLIEIIAKTLEDPLINWEAEKLIEIFVWVLVIAIAIIAGVFSRRFEQAIFFAIISTIITMAFFLIN